MNENPMEDLNYLLERGADVNVKPSNGETALSIAADKGNVECVELFLQQNTFVNIKNNKQETPLLVACRSGHLEVVRVLLGHGAKIFLSEWPDFKFSALHYATVRVRISICLSLLLLLLLFSRKHDINKN